MGQQKLRQFKEANEKLQGANKELTGNLAAMTAEKEKTERELSDAHSNELARVKEEMSQLETHKKEAL